MSLPFEQYNLTRLVHNDKCESAALTTGGDATTKSYGNLSLHKESMINVILIAVLSASPKPKLVAVVKFLASLASRQLKTIHKKNSTYVRFGPLLNGG